MKKILFAFCLAIIMINIASASLTTTHNWDTETKIASIYGSFGLDKIAEIQLIENTDFCLTKCHAIIKITPDEDINLDNNIDYKFNFYDKTGRDASSKINKFDTYKMVYENYTEYRDVYGDCIGSYWNENLSSNINYIYSCVTGTTELTKTRERWDKFTLTPSSFKKLDGPVYIKIEGQKGSQDSIDWIPIFYGEAINEMAWWSSADSKLPLTINTSGQILDSNTTILIDIDSSDTSKYGLGCANTFMVFNDVTEIDRDIFGCGSINSSLRFKIQANFNDTASQNYSIYFKSTATNSKNNSKFVYWTADDFTEASFNRTYWNVTAQNGCTNPTPLQGAGMVNLTAGSRCYWGLNISNGVLPSVKIEFAGILKTAGVNQYQIGLSNVSDWSAIEALPGSLGYPSILYGRIGGGVPAILVNNKTNTQTNNTATEAGTLKNYSLSWFENNTALFSFENGTTYSVNNFVTRNDTPVSMFIGSANLGVVTEQIDYIKVYKINRYPPIVSVGYEQIQEVSFNTHVLIGSTQRFMYNTTTHGANITSIVLTWNNTNYSTSLYSFGSYKFGSVRDLTIPGIGVSTLVNLTWTSFMDDGINITSDRFEQQVSNVAADNCSAYSLLLLNYTLKDEINQTPINATPYGNTSIEIQVDFYSQSGIAINTFNQSYYYINPAQVCVKSELLNYTDISIYTIVKYSSTDRVTELHHIQNRTVNNNSVPVNIDLYDLTSANSQEFKINVKDQYYLPYPNVLVDIARKYIPEGITKSVETPKTDIDGNTIGHFDLEGVIYTLIVTKNGQVLKTLSDVQPICTNSLTGDCTININLFSTTSSTTDFSTYKGLTYAMSFNQTNKRWTAIFTTGDGSSKTILLNVTRFDQYGNTTLCSDFVTTSGGSIFCDVPSGFGNVTTIATLYANSEYITSAMATITQTAAEKYGNGRIIIIAIMFMTLSLLFISSPIMTIIAPMIGIAFAIILNLMDGTIFGATSTLLYLVIAGGIILYKITRRE